MITVLLLAIVVAICTFEFYRNRRKYPPGPTPLPLIGNLLSLLWHEPGYTAFQKWKGRFGPVYTYWIGYVPVVGINDYDLIRETIIRDGETYADRYILSNFTVEYRGGNYGIAEANGGLWRVQRRFTLHTLRDFGLGKKDMGHRIVKEAEYMMQLLQKETKGGAAIEISKFLDRTVASVINSVLFGERINENNRTDFVRFRKMLDRQAEAYRNPAFILCTIFPNLKKMPIINNSYWNVVNERNNMYQYFYDQIEIHKRDIDYESEESRDFCESYLKEMKRLEDDPNTTFTSTQFVNVCVDMWIAGMETTSVTLAWGIIHLLRNPKIQRKMQEELNNVLGNSGRTVNIYDKAILPYSNAVISEIQRVSNILPMNLLRCANRDVTIGGHNIPEGTAICPQISMLLYDPEVFPDPYSFDPERFLDKQENLRKLDQFLPFSMGRRQCPGESLARMELFLFLTNLVYRFEISADDPNKLPGLRKRLTSSRPESFKCRLTPHFEMTN